MKKYQNTMQQLLTQLNQVVLGKEELLQNIIATMLAGGHVLLEDIPGVGKTMMALAISKSLGLDSNRVQFTPDVMPSDITGFSIYKKDTQEFVYQPGSVFCNLLLADEINRTSPKTQAALLEVMEEKQVTIEGKTRILPEPFVVIATQNPSGTVGTQMLPMAQLDRFLASFTVGYPDFQSEIQIAKGMDAREKIKQLPALISAEEFVQIQKEVENVFVHDSIYEYIVRLMTATRNMKEIEYGISPRGTIALVKMAKALAYLQGMDYVSPANVAHQFPAIARHRIELSARARMDGKSIEDVIRQVLEETTQPKLNSL